MEGNGGFADLDEVLRYSMEKELFEKLKENPAFLDSSVVLEMFFYINSQANLGMLSEIEEKLRSLRDSIVNNDSILKAQRILQAQIQNESVVTNNLIEQNMKTVNLVKLETIAKGMFTFTEAQLEQIIQVAFQCPYIGGKSVYDARGMYALIDEEYLFDDDAICTSGGGLRKANPRISGNDQIRVSPVPAQSIVTIEYILDENKDYSLTITDALGRVVYLNTMIGSLNSKEIDMTTWRDGIYYYHISDNESKNYSGKVNLIK